MRFLEASLKAIAQINKHMQATWGRERCRAAAWKRAASKFRAWQADTEAALERVSELNQRIAELEAAVATLEDKCDEYAAALNDRAQLCDRLRAYCRRDRRAVEMLGRELETRSGICACDVQDGWEQHRGGNTVGACWAAWARERAREEAAKTGTTQKGNG